MSAMVAIYIISRMWDCCYSDVWIQLQWYGFTNKAKICVQYITRKKTYYIATTTRIFRICLMDGCLPIMQLTVSTEGKTIVITVCSLWWYNDLLKLC